MALIERSRLKLGIDGARVIIHAAEQKATAIGAALAIAVTDDGGHLLAFARMDGARAHAIDVSMCKAFTAAISQRPTSMYSQVAAPGEQGFGLHMSNQGRFSIIRGGLPIVVDEQVVGGVGCSSGSAEEDEQAAQGGIDAFLEAVKKESS